MDNNAKNLYESTSQLYDKRHENDTTKHLRKREREMLSKYCHGLVLDVGCGTGEYASISENYVGVDIARNMLIEANNKNPEIFLVARAEELPFQKKFDTVICMFTVLNLCDIKKAVGEMKRVLKPGGTLIISVASVWDRKNYRFFDKLKDRYDSTTKNVRIEKNRMQFHLFTKEELLKVFEKEGFQPKEMHGVYKWQEPYWNKFVKFSRLQKAKLIIERGLPTKTARIFIAVFKAA